MIQKLKDSVEVKFGRRIAYQKDCKTLSDRLYEYSSQVVSPSTLRRFFGFLTTNSNPSRATLDILSAYCGYSDWNDFKTRNSATCNNEPILAIWEKGIAKARQISYKNCKTIKNDNPLGFSNTIPRSFANERLNTFINTDYIATPFVGPGGFGKTTLLVNWYEKFITNAQNHNHLILFIPAIHLENWIGKDIFLEEWLLSILELSGSGLFDTLNINPNLAPGKFILIIDALDEIELNPAKTEKVFSAIQRLTTMFSSYWFKLIISSRFSTWTSFLNSSSSMSGWLNADFEHLSSEGTNMPSLSEVEIQKVLDRTINKESNQRLIIEELPMDLVETISYPYYLQLFVDLYKIEAHHNISDRLDLLLEFIKKQIYQSSLADEKVDIINAIISISEKNKLFGPVKKNELKNLYPIHLKLAGNYATAYDQLVSFGILTEELTQNQYGILTKFVKIAQRQLYRVLLLQNLIEQNNGIDFSLFQKIDKHYSGSSIHPHLLNLLFELAYKQKKTDVLKKFFNLPQTSLEQVFTFSNIHQALTKDDLMRRDLIPYYANNPVARNLLFEKSININTIANSSRLLLFNYLQNCDRERDFFLGKILLNISNTYGFDFDWVENFTKELPADKLPDNTPPIIAGLWFSCNFFAFQIKDNSNLNYLLTNISAFTDKHSSQWTTLDKYNFELALAFGLIVTKQYGYMYERLSKIITSNESGYLTQEEKALSIYFEFAKWENSKSFDDITAQRVLQHLTDVPSWISYQTAIVGRAVLAMYYFTRGQIDKAYENYRKSVEISNIAGYTVFEVKLLVSLANILISIGEEERAQECMTFSRSLANKANIFFDSL